MLSWDKSVWLVINLFGWLMLVINLLTKTMGASKHQNYGSIQTGQMMVGYTHSKPLASGWVNSRLLLIGSKIACIQIKSLFGCVAPFYELSRAASNDGKKI